MRTNIPALAATLVGLLFVAPAASECNATTNPTIELRAGTVIGAVDHDVEYFRGIPYAQPPTGALRLKPPVPLKSFGPDPVDATGVGPACAQLTAVDPTPLWVEALALPGVAETLSFGSALGGLGEDCLTISVLRPRGTAADAKLPVLFWIHGGGFSSGSAQMYNGSVLVPQSVAQGKPMILVAVNYRLGAFGFLGGKQVFAEGVANLGLLDQRMGLEWVADNIAAFGGDPDAVTISGESAGAVSVFDQLALFDGDNTYKGRPLFRGAIMNSGSITPTEPVDSVKPQWIFDTVVEAAGCASAADSDKVECLRGVDYETLVNASNSVPGSLGYYSLALSYAPRQDGVALTASPEVLAQTGKYAQVPIIIGNQENEGTVFALFQANITTEAALVSYLNTIFFQHATPEEVAGLVATYPENPDSPGGVGPSNSTYAEFKRLAAILGDWEFILMSRLLLDTFPATVPAWSYQASYESGTPILGTYHTTDVPQLFVKTDDVSAAIQALYISFVDSLDPNNYAAGTTPSGYLTAWPTWQDGKQLLELGTESTRLIDGDARAASFEYIRAHIGSLHL
ncbi:Alpha/Beta hydrolase protein [Chaetomium fimeti]|uniref:Carboxylic ester hydrolase n=1 Tax=Chaetomium fimeti TaxID=1854472 RepID=A0AAE0LN66_9PEZI|nr:Alpha/Beta hydrolase protein [Chaetomium fimeti]